MGSFDVIEISALSAELPVWFPIGMYWYNGMLFKVAAVPFHFGHQFMKVLQR
jgi:hypothetical protein